MKKHQNGSTKTLGVLIIVAGLLMALYYGQKIFGNKTSEQPVANVEQPAQQPEVVPASDTAMNTQTQEVSPVSINIPTDKLSAVHGVGNESVLVPVPSQYTTKDELIHQDAYEPLMSLIAAAQADGINLTVVSAYRSYKRQKQIWENKWGGSANDDTEKALSILKWSSFPGTSRHHWGTEVDLNSVKLDYWDSAEGMAVYEWLTQNAPKFGFCQTYGPNRTKGYSEEAWHWSHIPTAQQYYDQIRHPEILALVTSQNVKGVEALRQLGTVQDYVTGISPCHPS